MLEARSLSKRYHGADAWILHEVSLSVAPGERLAVVGPSGCGKSTLLNCLGGLDQPTAGGVLLDGEDLGAVSAERLATLRATTIGFVFQEHHLLPQCSALENVLLPTLALARRPPRAESRAAAEGLLAQVGLAGKHDRRPGELSGGERQRVAVARALINRPRLLLADEPTGSLDPATADGIGDLLVDINRRLGTALIVVTHAEGLARRMDRRFVLRAGQLQAAGP